MTTYRVPRHVHSRTVRDEVILLDAHANSYVGLNASGAVAWTVLTQGGTAAAAVDEIVERFEVTRPTAENDVRRLLDDLLHRGLLVVAAS